MTQLYVALANLADSAARRLRGAEKGQSMIEYGLLAALIAAAVITAVTLLGSQVKSVFTNVANSL